MKWTARHCTAMLCTALFYSTLQCTAVHCDALWCTVMHYSALNSIQCTVLWCTSIHCIVPNCTALYCSALNCTILHCNITWDILAPITSFTTESMPNCADGSSYCSAVPRSYLYGRWYPTRYSRLYEITVAGTSFRRWPVLPNQPVGPLHHYDDQDNVNIAPAVRDYI